MNSFAALNLAHRLFWAEQNAQFETRINSRLLKFLPTEIQRDVKNVSRRLKNCDFPDFASKNLASLRHSSPLNVLMARIEVRCERQRKIAKKSRSSIGPDGFKLEDHISALVRQPANFHKRTKTLWPYFFEKLKELGAMPEFSYSNEREFIRYKTRKGKTKNYSYRRFANIVSKIRNSQFG